MKVKGGKAVPVIKNYAMKTQRMRGVEVDKHLHILNIGTRLCCVARWTDQARLELVCNLRRESNHGRPVFSLVSLLTELFQL